MRYFISDLHFYHQSLNARMDCRGFADGEEMNAYMIQQWNKKVRSSDEVIILGDFSYGKGKATNAIVEQLKGKLFLIEGNHDRFLTDRHFDRSRFGWIKPYAEVHDNKRKVVLSHYPIFCYNGQYRKAKDGSSKSYMLYGHVHNTFDELLVNQFQNQTRACLRPVFGEEEPQNIPCHMINCFCVFSDYVPLTLDEWIEVDQKRREGLPGLAL
ncbi:MAG: metallophosphoesterase family protein [Lachnospiraceae bacterium]|nr:metallophosphoesterase family protein [Lachnospiraceae bacterium]